MGVESEAVRRSVGQHLRRTRETLGWSLREVVERVSREGGRLSASTLSRLERGDTSVAFEEVIPLCTALGTSVTMIEEIVRATASRREIDLTGRTVPDLVREGVHFARAGAFERALGAFEAAHDLALLQNGRADRAEQLAEILLHKAETHRRLRRFATSLEVAGCVLNLAGCGREHTIRALLLHAGVYLARQDFFKARLFARRAHDLLDGASAEVRAYALAVIGSLECAEQHYTEAIPFLEESCELYRGTDRQFQFVKTSATLGFCEGIAGDEIRGQMLLEQAVRMAIHLRLTDVAAYATRLLGKVELHHGRLAEARQHFESAARLARRTGQVNDLFLAWYLLWRAEQVSSDAARRARIDGVLRRLLRRVDSGLPEVQEYVAATNRSLGGQRTIQP